MPSGRPAADGPPRSCFATDARSCADDKVAKVLADPVSTAPAWFWTDRACPRLGTARRSVGARIIAYGRLPSAGMAVETGTVVALRNLQRRWTLELRRRLSGHQRGTAVSDRCFSCMVSSLHRVSSAGWQLDSVAWDIALMASTSEGSSAASTHGRYPPRRPLELPRDGRSRTAGAGAARHRPPPRRRPARGPGAPHPAPRRRA